MESRNKPVLGIDFGASKIVVAYCDEKNNFQCEVILDQQEARSTSCCIAFTQNGRLFSKAAEYQAYTNPDNTFFGRDIKRLIGMKYEKAIESSNYLSDSLCFDDDEEVFSSIQYRNEKLEIYPEHVIAMLLSNLKENAETRIGRTISEAVVSVPSVFNTFQRFALKNAIAGAGFQEIALINNTTAAAVQYTIENDFSDSKNILIFDMGATSLEVGIFNVRNNNVETLANNGSLEIGGEHFTQILLDYFIEDFQSKIGVEITSDNKKLSRLRNACETVKIMLSTSNTASELIPTFHSEQSVKLNMTREQFELLSESLFTRISEIVNQTINDSKLNINEISDFIMIGGGGRIPRIEKIFKEIFNGRQISKTLNQDEAIAMGAAYYGSKKTFKVHEISFHQLNIESLGCPTIIAKRKGGKLPATNVTTLCNKTDNEWPCFYKFTQAAQILASIEEIDRDVKLMEFKTHIDQNGLISIDLGCDFASKTLSERLLDHRVLNAEKVAKVSTLNKKFETIESERKKLQQMVNEIETYAFKYKRQVTSKNLNFSEEEKHKVQTICDEVLAWLASEKNYKKEELLEKREQLDNICNPIINNEKRRAKCKIDTDAAHTYFKKKEFSKAIELYDTLIKEFSQEYDNYDDFIYNTYNRARSFCHLREYGNAIIDLNFVLEQKNIPFNMTLMSHFLRAKCYFNTNNHPGCLQDIDTVFQHSLIEIKKINEKLPNVTFTLKIKSTLAIAQSLITQKQCSEALNSLDLLLDYVLKKEYGDTDANLTGEIYLKRAYCKYLMDNHESAIQDLEKAVIFTKNHLEIIKLRAKCNFQLGNFDDAKSDSDSVLNQIDDGEIQELKEKINLKTDIKRLNQAWDSKDFENFIEISSKIKREYEKVDDDILLSMTKRRIEINFDLKKYLEGRSDCDLLLARDKKDFWALRWRIKFNFCLKNLKKVKNDCELYFVQFPTDEEIKKIFNSIDQKNNKSDDKKSFIEQAKRENAENSRRKNATYLELLQLDYAGIVPNVEPFECTICFVEYQEGEGVILRDCLHTFCKDCLSSTIQYCEDIEVMCPYKDTDYSCESVLQDREIKALVTPEMYEKHLAIRLRLIESQIKNTFHCLTANCTGWCIIEDEVNFFQCPVCNHENCITCRVIHEGKNCREYQDGLTSKESIDYLHQMVMSREAMHCPSCNIIIMKKSGCDGMTCSICKTEICWATRGPRRGPNGCRCRENGKKCHVSCVNCH